MLEMVWHSHFVSICGLFFVPRLMYGLEVQRSALRAVAGQRSSPESGFVNITKMFFRAKNKRREITGPYKIGHCYLNLI